MNKRYEPAHWIFLVRLMMLVFTCATFRFYELIMVDMVKCTVLDHQNKLPPFIVSFEHGNLNICEDVSSLHCSVYKERSSKKRVVTIKTDSLLYKSTKIPHIQGNINSTLIAIRNRRTNKMRIVEGEVHNLAPYMREDDAEFHNTDDLLTGENKVAALNKTFGSKRARQNIERVEKTNVHINQGHLTKISQDISFNKDDLSLKSGMQENFMDHIPPVNCTASDVRKVYEIENMLTPDELESLEKKCIEILDVDEVYNTDGHSELFKTYLLNIKAKKDRNLLKALLYAESIVNFLAIPFTKLNNSNIKICTFSSKIQYNVLSKFTAIFEGGRTLPNSKRDKALCYLIVLGLLISDFQLDLEQMKTFLHNVGIKKLLELSKAVGAVPLKEKKTVVTLKLPLPELDKVNIKNTKRWKK